MRGIIYKIFLGIAFLLTPSVLADDFSVLVIPDNIIMNNTAVDSFLHNETAEFFADEIITLLNDTQYIQTKPVSVVRKELNSDNFVRNSAKSLTNHFKSTYNVDYNALKRISDKMNCNYILLLTSSTDAENYILRRTVWDFLNIPGATVVDPAYKISTYGVLIDVKNNKKLWSDTYYKTISVCENRIITRGFSPQTEQLAKIKDYSRYICPQIARQVQLKILPQNIYAKETCKIDYDLGNIDNVFTKKYRHLGIENKKIYEQKSTSTKEYIEKYKAEKELARQKRMEELKEKERQLKMNVDAKLDVKARPVYEKDISTNQLHINNYEKNAVYEKQSENEILDIQSDFKPINVKKNRKNNLWGIRNDDRPVLRDYN